jgi:hypothetical protein
MAHKKRRCDLCGNEYTVLAPGPPSAIRSMILAYRSRMADVVPGVVPAKATKRSCSMLAGAPTGLKRRIEMVTKMVTNSSA